MANPRARHKASRGRRWVPWLIAVAVTLTTSAAFAASLPLSSHNLTVYRTCYLWPISGTDTAEFDSYVYQKNATTNYGTATTLSASAQVNNNMRTYLRFDLTLCSPALPTTASAIKQATLLLYGSAVPASCRTYDIFPVTATWTETGITWSNQPFGTAFNNPPSSQRTSYITIGATPCQNTAAGWVNGWDVTADVRNFASGAQTNYGWMIRDDVEQSANYATTFASEEDTTSPNRRPPLIITYQT
jgi:hypothetical protein